MSGIWALFLTWLVCIHPFHPQALTLDEKLTDTLSQSLQVPLPVFLDSPLPLFIPNSLGWRSFRALRGRADDSRKCMSGGYLMLLSSHNILQYGWFIVPIITHCARNPQGSATRIRLSQNTGGESIEPGY